MNRAVFILHKIVTGEVYGVDDVSQSIFEEWLSQHHNEMPSLSEKDYVENQDWKILLTFDDGYHCNYDIVMNLLEKYSVTAIFFIVSEYIGKPGYLTQCQLKKLAEKNFLIGSHTVNHADCSDLTVEEFTNELQESKRSIEKIIQKEIRYFSFPYGREFKKFDKYLFNTYEIYFNSKPGPYNEFKNTISRYPLNSFSKIDTIKKISNNKLYILGYKLRYRMKELVKFILPSGFYQSLRQKL